MTEINIEYAKKLYPIFTKKKRIKIIVGGRASTKSTGVADYVLGCMSAGQLWCCAREHQNSIEESVHRTVLDEIARLGVSGFGQTKSGINHVSGGRNFYRGLARNITSIKSTLTGVDGLWIEEGEDISENTVRVLTSSLRLNATDAQRLIDGEDVKMPEIIITMNRGSRNGAIAKKYLARAEKALSLNGIYEDDTVLIVQINYNEIPREWWLASGLEQERADDELHMTGAQYRHKWHGDYLEEVDDAIIKTEWFDACIDAHEKLGFKAEGIEVVAHDPSDTGADDKGLAYRHGSVFLDVQSKSTGDVNEGADWAIEYAMKVKPDVFIWDGDGLGSALRRQFNEALGRKKVTLEMFKGSNSPDNPDDYYEEGFDENPKTNGKTFRNKRSQYYWDLRDRIYRTYLAVKEGKYTNPDDMIAFSSGIDCIDLLRSEVCRIPLKRNTNGFIQIMSKVDMKRLGIDSPNCADSVMIALANPAIDEVDQVRLRKPFVIADKKAGY